MGYNLIITKPHETAKGKKLKGECVMIRETVEKLMLPYNGGEKLVRVYIPEHEEGETFPVVYMTDGQNLFEDDTVQFGCWYTREAVRAEREKNGRGAVIVGIHSSTDAIERANELSAKSVGGFNIPPEMPEEEKRRIDPSGEKFDDFIIHTVMPEIEAGFPVKKGREHTAFCGSSMGGLQSFYTTVTHKDLFSYAGVFSPAFMFYLSDDLEKWIRANVDSSAPYLYLYTGGADPLEQEIMKSEKMVYGILEECCPDRLHKNIVLPEENHNETAWAKVFTDFLGLFLSESYKG